MEVKLPTNLDSFEFADTVLKDAPRRNNITAIECDGFRTTRHQGHDIYLVINIRYRITTVFMTKSKIHVTKWRQLA